MKKLLKIIETLRNPVTGCPWDIDQTIQSVAPYTLEEAYELVDAIEHKDMQELKLELGDLLYHVVFYAQMAKENGDFDFQEVVNAISNKLVERHPHVFLVDETNGKAKIEQDLLEDAWETSKELERADKIGMEKSPILYGVAKALPALKRAQKLQKRASREGFDWPTLEPVIGKIHEEFQELMTAMQQNQQAEISEEMGDLIFSCVNLARHLNVDAEEALRHCNDKFTRRFNYIEDILRVKGRTIKSCDIDQLEALWCEAKDNV
ncbi:Nucleoside triphosphate pyrophosphohydrolase MazG [hydrothermal vent metagenome]|uniref:Nucleoside triphosphate pyrophosphohydrolase MazG n=1 Tax=hydrothermal vent metagenome TaxID=652676 RepID=A0A3B0XM88_9ZZZZ